jgi:Flp pilus assembly CpaF family ATPase
VNANGDGSAAAFADLAAIDPSMEAEFVRDLRRLLNEHEPAERPLSPEARRHLGAKLAGDLHKANRLERIASGRPDITDGAKAALTEAALDRVFSWGQALQPLLDDPTVVEINAQGCDDVWVHYGDGRRERWRGRVAATDRAMEDVIREIARGDELAERRFDEAWPQVDMTLPNGDRFFAVTAVCRRPNFSIRRHDFIQYVTLDQQVAAGMLDKGLAAFLGSAVRARKNIIICGGTGAGKTTNLRGLCNEIHASERLVTIEDCFELHLDRLYFPETDEDRRLERRRRRHPQVLALQVRQPNIEGRGGISARDLNRWALRANPDRLIHGETRDDGSVIPMLSGMSQGNDGSMSTIHANSPRTACGKLASYARSASEQWDPETTAIAIANAVHLIVHLVRRNDAERQSVEMFMSSVAEVAGFDGQTVLLNHVYTPGPDRRAVPNPEGRPSEELLSDLEDAGFDRSMLARPEGWWRQ